jgi:S-adenosylmethionine synthetase
MPLALDISHKILIELADIRKKGVEMTYLRPDSKSQVTLEYNDDHTPKRITDIVVSTQHDDFADEKPMQEQIEKDVRELLIPKIKSQLSDKNAALFGDEKYHVNPTGKFVIGGPHGDTGLTGRKIIVDTYGGAAPHGGGAFSGKDPTKVDRSAAYVSRYLAKNIVAAGVSNKCLIQLAYAIGVSKPLSIYVKLEEKDEEKNEDIKKKIEKNFDLSPRGIRELLGLNKSIYEATAAYGHFGRKPTDNGEFSWEKTDKASIFKM